MATLVVKSLKELQKYLCVKNCRTNPYHPMCNGMLERLNSTLFQMLRKGKICQSKWKDELKKLVYENNCIKHTVTRYSRLSFAFLKKPRLPVDFILRKQQNKEKKQKFQLMSKIMERKNK